MTTLALLLFAILPRDAAVAERVDLIEVNHYHNCEGGLVLSQAVFWEWRKQSGEWHVKAWRLLKNKDQRPTHDYARGDYAMVFSDGALMRHVRAPLFRETWTQHDVERTERDRLPNEHRAGLMMERQLVE